MSDLFLDLLDAFEEIAKIKNKEEVIEDIKKLRDDYDNHSSEYIGSLNEDATLNISEEEMFDFLDDLGGYTDYNGRIDAIVDEFGLGKDEAEDVVWNWTLKNEDSEDEETVEDAIIDEPEEEKSWIKVISKPVPDSDGFLTDYTMYRDISDENHYVFVFGDNEIYKPEDGDWDYEAFSNSEATEWYNNYEGFVDDDESADDDIEDLNDYLTDKE